jgi:hypothetical protein
MTNSQEVTPRGRVRGEVVGALGVIALGLAAGIVQRSRSDTRRQRPLVKRAALAAYLRDHLAGADAAIHVVGHLKAAQLGRPDGTLFAWLHEQFQIDRDVVIAMLTELRVSPRSVKLLAGHAAGTVLKAAAGTRPGELSLFRTMEGLSVGVQGKRCLWRAAQALAPPLRAPGGRTWGELESRAADQWEAIERYRLALVAQTLGV